MNNPRSSCALIDFVNDLKKTGLYVLGHVNTGAMDDSQTPDPTMAESLKWLSLIDYLKVKAFVELTLCETVREGARHLIRMSGLGGMKPNTVCLGFYDDIVPGDSLARYQVVASRQSRLVLRRRFDASASSGGSGGGLEDSNAELAGNFPDVRNTTQGKLLTAVEYVGIVCDSLRMNKNVCLHRHFNLFNKQSILAPSSSDRRSQYIDVWPVNFFMPSQSAAQFDSTCLFVLQLACILHMVPAWKRHTTLRVFAPVMHGSSPGESEYRRQRLRHYLTALRIHGKVQVVQHDDWQTNPTTAGECNFLSSLPSDEYLRKINGLIQEQCGRTAVLFLYLPIPPVEYSQHTQYLHCLEVLTNNLPPTVLVHGLHPVTSTTL